MENDAALALVRWLRDLPTLLLWGGSLFAAAAAPVRLRQRLEARYRGWQRRMAALAFVAVAALLPLQAAALGDGWHDALAPRLLGAIFSGTALGPLWVAQAVAAAALLALAVTDLPGRTAATAVVSALLLAGIAAGGHAAMRAGWPGLAQRGGTWIHLLAGGFWLGGLVPLLAVLRDLGRADRADALLALRRFSTLGHWAVGLVLATGTIDAVLILGASPLGQPSAYRVLLAAKIACVLGMVGLALLNRYRFVGQWQRGEAIARDRIRRATLAELGLGAAAVALVAAFGLMDPG